jgi:hypothetical protein
MTELSFNPNDQNISLSDTIVDETNDSTLNPEKFTSADTIEEQYRPDELPDKFWDAEHSEVRTDALVKSYLSLEKKLGGGDGIDRPDTADDYSITSPSDYITSNPELNGRLHEAGFSQSQAQLVYDLAEEHLSPLINEMSAELEAQH